MLGESCSTLDGDASDQNLLSEPVTEAVQKETWFSFDRQKSYIVYNLQDQQVVEGLVDVGQDHHMELALVVRYLSLFLLHE